MITSSRKLETFEKGDIVRVKASPGIYKTSFYHDMVGIVIDCMYPEFCILLNGEQVWISQCDLLKVEEENER